MMAVRSPNFYCVTTPHLFNGWIVWKFNESELCVAVHNCTDGASVSGSTSLTCLILNEGWADTPSLLWHDTLSVDGLLLW